MGILKALQRGSGHTMTYSDFTLESVSKAFHLKLSRAALFPQVAAVEVPSWLADALARGRPFALGSEKARSELIVVPVLLASIERSNYALSLYSGQRLDVAPDRGLSGECDFILTNMPALPIVQSPVVMIVEAKKNDIEGGLGQCIAQMLGAQLFNEREGSDMRTIVGCVTTGESWQFLRLESDAVLIDIDRYYLVNVGVLLGIFDAITAFYQVPRSCC